MSEQSRPGDVLRANAGGECGLPIGQMHMKIKDSPRPFETVSIYCNLKPQHLEGCKFVGTQLTIERTRT